MRFDRRWRTYVPVAQRRANAAREAKRLAKDGQTLRPIRISSRDIAKSFWGVSWCKNLERYADWANRLPRGRSYARNGFIVDLQIEPGVIKSKVNGSSLYEINITIDKLDEKKWAAIRKDCAQRVSSLLDLMRGHLPEAVLERLSDPQSGMFPSPRELKLRCSCPDYAIMCKHVAATLYGVGHLLDSEPQLFFKMRGVDQSDLVSEAMTAESTSDVLGMDRASELMGEDLGALFGIDLVGADEGPSSAGPSNTASEKATRKKATRKKAADKKATYKKAADEKEADKKAAHKTEARTTEAHTKAARKKAAHKKAANKKAANKRPNANGASRPRTLAKAGLAEESVGKNGSRKGQTEASAKAARTRDSQSATLNSSIPTSKKAKRRPSELAKSRKKATRTRTPSAAASQPPVGKKNQRIT